MNKIDSAVYEIHAMDTLAARDQWMNEVHPLVKFIVTVVYMAAAVSFSKYDVAGLAGMAVYPIAVFILSENSFRDSVRRLRMVLPLVCLVGVFNPFFDKNIVMLGGMAVRGGVLSMITLILKGVFTVLAAYLLMATTSLEKLCCALRMLHIPRLMVTQFLLTCRYITLLLEEADRITQAYALRAPGQRGVHFRVWGSLAGQLLLRTMDRAGEVYESMELRGYRGDFGYMGERLMFRWQDGAYLIFWLGVITLFRMVPVVSVVGGID